MPRQRSRGDARKLTVAETAERLKVSIDTVHRLIADGELVAIDVATRGTRRNLRVPVADIEKFEARRAVS
jgi:excisionase family DNA binding protein